MEPARPARGRPAPERLDAATELMKNHIEQVNQSTQNWVDVVQDHLHADRAPLDVILRTIGTLDARLSVRLDKIDRHLGTMDRRQTMIEHRLFAVSTNNIMRMINLRADAPDDHLTPLVSEVDGGEFLIGERIPHFPHTVADSRILRPDVRRSILTALHIQHEQFGDDYVEFMVANANGLHFSSK